MSLLGPRLLFVPIAIAFVLFEIYVLRTDRARSDPRYTGFGWRDTISAPVVGAAAQVLGLANRFLLVQVAALYVPFVLLEVHNPVVDYAVAIVAWDFAFYWFHRISHRTALGWSSHVTHHESPYFNFSVALRLEWFPVVGLLTYPPIALLGVSPEAMAAAVLVNGFYGGIIHTEMVPQLPRPVEWLFNTPWHHRVHHRRATSGGSNFSNTFIVWDRMFGTFESMAENQGPYGVDLPPSPYGVLGTPLHRFSSLFLRPTAARLCALVGNIRSDASGARASAPDGARRHGTYDGFVDAATSPLDGAEHEALARSLSP